MIYPYSVCYMEKVGKLSLSSAIINSTKYSNIPDQMAFQLIGKPHRSVWFYFRNHDVCLCTLWRCYISVGVSHVILNVKTGWYLMVASRFMSVIRRSHKNWCWCAYVLKLHAARTRLHALLVVQTTPLLTMKECYLIATRSTAKLKANLYKWFLPGFVFCYYKWPLIGG